MSLKRRLRRVRDRLLGTELDRGLRRIAGVARPRVLLCWNRGLGDIALGLCAVFVRIREASPGVQITVVTRADLEEAFRLTDADVVLASPELRRGDAHGFAHACERLGIDPSQYDLAFGRPDPSAWLAADRVARFVPRLRWRSDWDALAERFPEVPRQAGIVIAAHASSETARFYGYVKDWPAERWRELIARFADDSRLRWVLFGHAQPERFELPGVVDLRGRTSFLEVLSLIRNRSQVLVAVDSGILSVAYYLDEQFPLEVVSLWSDPRQGVLKHGVDSPNRGLTHVALVGDGEDVRRLGVDAVEAALRAALARVGARSGLQRARAPDA
jgi:hypothetical protein